MTAKREILNDITYVQLSELYYSHLLNNAKSKQIAKNAKSAISSWCFALNIDINSAPSSDFFHKFGEFEKQYVKNQISNRISKKTYNPRLSIMRKVRNFCIKNAHNQNQNLPQKFCQRLLFLLGLNGYTAKEFWRDNLANLTSYKTFLKWSRGKCLPSRVNSLKAVTLIENKLNLEEGTLISLLLLKGEIEKKTKTKFARKLCVLLKKKYTVWTDELEDEFQELIDFKSKIIFSDDLFVAKNSHWTGKNEKGIPPSADLLKSKLKSFFGFCCLPLDSSDQMLQGLGIEKKHLSLALLTDYNIIKKYITVFSLARSGGKYNNSSLTFISSITSLLRKGTGYIYQKPDFAKKLYISADKEEWQEICLKTREKLLKIENFIRQEKKAGGDGFELGRDPREPIENILNLPRPLSAVFEMMARMVSNLDKFPSNSLRKSVFVRNLLLIAILQANPLRVSMLSRMEIGRHLIKKKDGSWWIVFHRSEFKNRKSLKSDYETRLAPELWQMVDRYIKYFRPKLYGSSESNYLFLKNKKNSHFNKFNLNSARLSSIVFSLTNKYISDSPGFGPHAFRHIIATDIIKGDPSYGFFLAAKVLHDNPKTVEENYAHLKTSEMFEPYNEIFSNRWSEYITQDINFGITDPASEIENGNEGGKAE